MKELNLRIGTTPVTFEVEDLSDETAAEFQKLFSFVEKQIDELSESVADERQRIADCETALHECRQALLYLFQWHKGFDSRHSTKCDKAIQQANAAAVAITQYLNHYGAAKPLLVAGQA